MPEARSFFPTVLVSYILWFSWLAMMLIHETGHVLGALCSGGHVQRVIWHPFVLSRTDVQPNPHPLVEIWAGPIFGSVLPVVIAGAMSACRVRMAYLGWLVAGFCLIANGAYLGIGAFEPIGDAHDLLARGVPRWVLSVFGAVAVSAGLWLWHRVGERRRATADVSADGRRDVYLMAALSLGLTLVGLIFGSK